MAFETLSRRSFLGVEGQHVFVAGAASAIGAEAVREFLGRLFRCSLLNLCPDCLPYLPHSLP